MYAVCFSALFSSSRSWLQRQIAWVGCCGATAAYVACFFPPPSSAKIFFSSFPHRRDVSSQTTACELVFRFVWFCCIILIQHTSPGSQIFTFMRSAFFFFFFLPLVVHNRGKRNVWKKLGHETAHKLVNQPVLLNLPWHKKKHARFSRGFKQVLSLAKWRD